MVPVNRSCRRQLMLLFFVEKYSAVWVLQTSWCHAVPQSTKKSENLSRANWPPTPATWLTDSRSPSSLLQCKYWRRPFRITNSCAGWIHMSVGMKQTEEWEVPALPVSKYQSTLKSYEGAAHGSNLCSQWERALWNTWNKEEKKEESLTP